MQAAVGEGVWKLESEAHHLSRRHRKRELSTEAHARRISGNTPQKATVWQALYRSVTMAGISFTTGDSMRSWEGHCKGAKKSGGVISG